MYEALRIGRVDAVIVDPPYSVMLKRGGFPVLAYLPDVFPLPAGGLGATLGKIKSDRAEVKRVLKGELTALRSLRSGPAAVKRVMQKRLALDAQMAEDTYNFMQGSFT